MQLFVGYFVLLFDWIVVDHPLNQGELVPIHELVIKIEVDVLKAVPDYLLGSR